MKKPPPGHHGWYRAFGRSARADLWVMLECDGPEELPDGRWLEREVAFGRGDEYGFRWWFRRQEPSRATRYGDVLWGTSAALVVSQRFVEVIGELSAGWSTYPIVVLDRNDEPIGGYVGFIPDLTGTQALVSQGWRTGWPAYSFLLTERVLDGLLAAGVDQFDVEPAEQDDAPPPFVVG